MSQFILKIKLGNDAMSTPYDVADALRTVAEQLENGFTARRITDKNGNDVGQYKMTEKSSIIEVD